MAPTSTPKVVGITEAATAVGLKPNELTKMKQRGEFDLSPVGTVSGRDAYDARQVERWAKSHLKGATTTATRTRAARTGAAPGRSRARRSNPYA